MDCGKAWNREFIRTALTKTFITNDLKKFRENVLLQKEISMLPETQPFVEAEVTARTLAKKAEELTFKNQQLHELILTNEREMQRLYRRINELRTNGFTGSDENEVERRTFVRPCPADNCRGFLSTRWKCGLCQVRVCRECHEIKGTGDDEEQAADGHVCKPENVETAKAMQKETKPCPNCSARIFKIDGCDQMFCTICKTAFSWRTGAIERSRIHNPHYYEWLRQNGGEVPRNPGDIPCGGIQMADPYYATRFERRYNNRHNVGEVRLSGFSRLIVHMSEVELRRYRVDEIADNRHLRIKYMLNEINDDELKRELQQREKKRDKQQNIHQILDMYVTTGSELLNRLMQGEPSDRSGFERYITQLVSLSEYTNTCLERVEKLYSCKLARIDMQKLVFRREKKVVPPQ
jgi:hypothetical protein